MFIKRHWRVGEPKPLFSTIPAAKLEECREAYGGSAAKEQKILEAEKAPAKKAAKKEKKKTEEGVFNIKRGRVSS
jgi:methionyl-tRNA synthetase